MSNDRQHATATLRNRDFIRDVLPTTGVILEIASGLGERVVHFARCFPKLVFNLPILILMHGSVSPHGPRRQASRMYTRPLPSRLLKKSAEKALVFAFAA
jgi:hypothetical protein